MVISNELKPGNYFTYEGNIYVVMETLHNKTAMAKMVIKLKTKNLRTGAITNISLSIWMSSTFSPPDNEMFVIAPVLKFLVFNLITIFAIAVLLCKVSITT